MSSHDRRTGVAKRFPLRGVGSILDATALCLVYLFFWVAGWSLAGAFLAGVIGFGLTELLFHGEPIGLAYFTLPVHLAWGGAIGGIMWGTLTGARILIRSAREEVKQDTSNEP